MKGCGVGAGGVHEAATHFSAEIKKFANRMETERGATKVGVAALRSAVKKIGKHLKVKDVILELLDFPVDEPRPRPEWSARRESAGPVPVQKILAALGTPKKETSPQELFLDFLSNGLRSLWVTSGSEVLRVSFTLRNSLVKLQMLTSVL